jgi:Ca2+-binding EF-hand superfamily protein
MQADILKELMLPRRKILWGIGGLLAAGTAGQTAFAGQNGDPTPQSKKNKNLTKGEKEAKKLLLLMDADKNGMISKQEFMSFMEAEFDRLDKDKSGELDVQELTQSNLRPNTAIHGR